MADGFYSRQGGGSTGDISTASKNYWQVCVSADDAATRSIFHRMVHRRNLWEDAAENYVRSRKNGQSQEAQILGLQMTDGT